MTEVYRPTKTWSLITIAGLSFISFFHVLMVFTGVGAMLRPESIIDLGEEGPMSAWYMVYGLLTLANVPVTIATIVVFLIWLNRSYKNLLALRPSFLRFSSGWAVGWWFIPFANLVRPFQVVREVWWESDPEIPQDQMFLTESLHSAPTFMALWWGFWLAANIVTNGVDKLFDPERTDNVATMGLGFVVASSLTIIAAGLAIKVVRDITSRQAARFVSVQRLERSEYGYDHSEGSPTTANS